MVVVLGANRLDARGQSLKGERTHDWAGSGSLAPSPKLCPAWSVKLEAHGGTDHWGGWAPGWPWVWPRGGG